MSAAQIQMMTNEGRREATVDATRRRAAMQHDPKLAEQRRNAALRNKQQQLAMQRAVEDENRTLKREFGR